MMAVSTAILDDPYLPLRGRETIPLAEIAPWAALAIVIATIFLYFVSTEQGAYAIFEGTTVHEFVHDARHLLGFPCH